MLYMDFMPHLCPMSLKPEFSGLRIARVKYNIREKIGVFEIFGCMHCPG